MTFLDFIAKQTLYMRKKYAGRRLRIRVNLTLGLDLTRLRY